ncbi:MAG: helix-turn-helix transcriptional regulator [Cytophagales bacterium]|nr:helix-turn-helix transcriptional regulator [Cytophagales bacterium]
MAEQKLTKLGEYLNKRAVNKSQISRRTGISKQRLSELSINTATKLRADELYQIAVAIEADPCALLEYVCGHLRQTVKLATL